MRKFTVFFIILILVCFSATCFAAKNKGTDDQTRAKIINLLNSIPETSWGELKANEAAYMNKMIKMSGLKVVRTNTTPSGFVIILVNSQGQYVFLGSMNLYPWQKEVEYTVCGEFRGFDTAERMPGDTVNMAFILEIAHFPWYNE